MDYIISSGITSDGIILENDYMSVLDGGTANNTMVREDGGMSVSSGGTANNTTVSGGNLRVYSGGTATDIVWTPCEGHVYVQGGYATFASEYKGVYYGSDNKLLSHVTVMDGKKIRAYLNEMYVMYGGIANRTTVESNGWMYISSGGTANSTTVNIGGDMYISSGGTANSTTVNSRGRLFVYNGGTANNTTVNEVGELFVYNGGIANSTTVNEVGNMWVSSGGTANDTSVSGGDLHVYSGGTANDTTLSDWGGMYIDSGGTACNTIVNAWCKLHICRGGTATDIVWTPCEGHVITDDGAVVTFVSQYSGVYFGSDNKLLSNAAVMDGMTLNPSEVLDGGSGEMCVMSGGTANSTTVNLGDMYIYSGGTANNTIFNWGGNLYVYSGGTANSTIIDNNMCIFGGTANNTTVNSNGLLFVYRDGIVNSTVMFGSQLVVSGGTANNTIINNGSMYVSSGGIAGKTVANEGGSLFLESGGSANDITVNSGGFLRINRSGAATEITENGGYVDVASDAKAAFVSNTLSGLVLFGANAIMMFGYTASGVSASVHSGTTANSTMVNYGGNLYVFSGGTANSTMVNYGGNLYVSSGGTASIVFNPFGGSISSQAGAVVTYFERDANVYYGNAKSGTISSANTMTELAIAQGLSAFVYQDGRVNSTTVNTGGSLYVSSGGTANSTTVNDGGDMNVFSGGTVNSTTVNNGGILTVYSGGIAIDITVKRDGILYIDTDDGGGKLTGKMTFENGAVISASAGAILDFDLTQTSAGAAALVNDLSCVDGTPIYTLTVSGTESSGAYSLADGVSVFSSVLSVMNTSGEQLGSLMAGQKLETEYAEYSLKVANGSLTVTVKAAEIKPPDTNAPTVSSIRASTTKQTDQAVTVTAVFADDVALKSSLYKLGENGVWTNYENGVTVTENTTVYFKAVDTSGNESEIASYKVANIKKAGSDDPAGMPDGGRNNWLYDKKLGINPDSGDFIETDVSAATEEIKLDKDDDVDSLKWLNYVGYDDPMDFARISLENDAKLSFLANATGVAKLVIYRLTEGTGKKAGTYTLKALQTTTLKKPKGATEYSAETKGLLLAAGDYYIAVKSTGTKKGSVAYYNVTLNEKSAFFTNGDDGWNNWLYEKKTGPNPNRNDFITTVLSSSTEEIRLDRDGDVDSEDWLNFVGYGDAADYAKIVLNGDAKIGFTIQATDAAKFVIYRLKEKVGKNGTISYSKKALQTTKLKKDKITQLYTVNTKALKLTAGEYYISVQSTNAKKGGNAYYNVNLNEKRCQFAENAAKSALPDAGSADALSRPDDLSFGQYNENATLAAASDFIAESIFEESGKGMLASL